MARDRGGWGRCAALACALFALAVTASAAPRNRRIVGPQLRHLAFYNTHTGERVDAVYWVDGRYQPEALTRIDRVLRDHRTSQVKAIDRRVLDLLYELGGRLGTSQPYHVISAYRSPESNAYLRGLSPTSGVAERSQHILGRAIDVRVPDLAIETIRNAALRMKRGGVGYYPASDFVHVDVGPVRRW
jgi:uncharacterized protein YcbK (DUF882 family)